jgi:uncharacterized protein YaaQ
MTQTELISKRLDGKIAVVTGGSSGIGLATAQRFVQEGAYTFIFGRDQSEIEAAERRIGKNVTGVQGDVSNIADLDRLYDMVKQQKGRIDVLFANAGILEFAPLGSITESQFDKSFDINVKGLHRAKSASHISGWWFYHSDCFGQRIHRIRGDECLQRNQGSRPILRALLDCRSETPQDPCQCYQPWSDRHTDDQKHDTG